MANAQGVIWGISSVRNAAVRQEGCTTDRSGALSSAVLLLHITDISGNSRAALALPCPAARTPLHHSKAVQLYKMDWDS